LKIALLGPAPPDRGGIAHETARLAVGLSRLCAVDYLTYSRPYPRWLDPRRFDVDPRLSAAPAEPIFDYLSPLSWRQTGERIAASAPAAVLVPWWTSFWGLPVRALFRGLERRAPDVSRVMLCHNLEDHESGPLQRFLTQGALGAAQAFVVHSEASRDALVRRFPQAPVLAVPLPSLSLEEAGASRQDARRELGLPPEPLVLFLGLVRRYKGVDLLLQAAPAIAAATGARIAIVGEVFPDMADLKKRWDMSPARDSVLWKDEYVSEREMALWLGACDAVVLPYRRISSSAIAARAIGARRPIAAASVGGLAESVEAGSTGELFPPGDVAGLTAAVLTILSRGAASYEPGLAAAAEKRSWPSYAQAILSFISSLKTDSRQPTADS
jgi:glycosyltransferase involved in cell wall biosynthesis